MAAANPDADAAAVQVSGVKVFVRGLMIQAEIGVHPHEYGAPQPLIADVELDITPGDFHRLSETFNYERIAEKAKKVAAAGHFQLVEAFAEQLGRDCLADERVSRARVRVEKPNALAPQAEAAGAEIVLVRG